MSPDQHLAVFPHPQRVTAVLRFNLQLGIAGYVVEVHAALDLRADDVAVHFVTQVRMRDAARLTLHVIPTYGPDYRPEPFALIQTNFRPADVCARHSAVGTRTSELVTSSSTRLPSS